MSRARRFAHALASGYVLLAANMLYTVASVPLALHYLPNAEFALWGVATQLAGYIALVDLGLSGAMARIFIDYKDEPTGSTYGSVVQTAFWVSAVQGIFILIVSLGLIFSVGHVPEVPAELDRDFRWLMAGQAALVAAGFFTRIFYNILWAHQRMDIVNYIQSALFPASLGVLWFCLARGSGMLSVLWAQLVFWGVGAIVQAASCAKLGLFPRPGRWGRPTWARFHELFVFGKDIFLFSLGGQMINASQAILVTRCLGLDAAAVWSVCTRTYLVVCQLVWKIFDVASTPLAEMLVRGETALCTQRFRSVTLLASSAAVLSSILFVVCNQPFVQLWTRGGSPAFSAASFKDLPAFASRLKQPPDELSAFIVERLNTETKTALSQYQPGAPVPQTLRTNLIQSLNAIVKGESLHHPAFSSRIGADPEIRRRWAQKQEGKNRECLNRLLLEHAFPLEISKYVIRWSAWNDLLLGIWAVVMAIQRCHVGMLGAKKQLQVVKYIYFLEGMLFVCLALLFTRRGGFPALIASSIVATTTCSFLYGLHATSRDFQVRWRNLFCDWMGPAGRLALGLAPLAWMVWAQASILPPAASFIVMGAIVGIAGGLLFFRIGLDDALKSEIGGKLPAKAAAVLGLRGKTGA